LVPAPTSSRPRPAPTDDDRLTDFDPDLDTDDLYTDRHHVFFLIAPRYTIVVPRL
jgi:hypothetical protein